MMQSSWIESEFNQARIRFKEYEHQMPLPVSFRLIDIFGLVNGNTKETQDQTLSCLASISASALKIFYCQAVRLVTMVLPRITRPCQLKSKSYFKSWSDAVMAHDFRLLTITSNNKNLQYSFLNLSCGNLKPEKRTFDLFREQKFELTIKFPNIQAYNAALSLIGQCAENQYFRIHQVSNKPLIAQLSSSCADQPSPPQIQQEDEDSGLPPMQASGLLLGEKGEKSTKEVSTAQSLENNNKIQNGTFNQIEAGYGFDFQTVKESKSMKMRMHLSQAKILLRLHTELPFEPEQILYQFCFQKEWNSMILSEEISIPKVNVMLVYRVFKSASLMNRIRETYTEAEYFPHPKTPFIIEKHVQNSNYKEQYTRATLSTKARVSREGNSTVFEMMAELDGKGYCTVQDSQNMLVMMLKDAQYFEDYFNIWKLTTEQGEVGFSKFSKNQQLEEILAVNTERRQLRNRDQEIVDVPFEHEISPTNIVNESEEMHTVRSSFNRSLDEESFQPKSALEKPTDDFMNWIDELGHHRLYLKKRFTQTRLEVWDEEEPFYSFRNMIKQEYSITPNGQLVFVNFDLIQSQKDTLKYVARQIGANLISGKSVMNVSLPVTIFEPRSGLERGVASFGYAPDYLLPIAKAPKLDQLKHVCQLLISLPSLELLMQKPFNPILGQTFQAYIKGIPMYYEQISHHPPISAYFMKCEEFTLYGNLIAFADMGLNSAVGGNSGAMHIILQNGSHFECYFNPCEISGLIYGDRKFKAYGRGYILQRASKLYCEFSFEKARKNIYQCNDKPRLMPADLIGAIFTVTDEFFHDFDSYSTIKKFPGISKSHILEKHCQISGKWFDTILFDKERFFITQTSQSHSLHLKRGSSSRSDNSHTINIQSSPLLQAQQPNHRVKAYPVQYCKVVLPSDSRYRIDVMQHRKGDLTLSQRHKQVLQAAQRKDRKLRESRK